MIVYIRGILAEKEPTRAVVEAAGVGYEINIPVSTYERLPPTNDPVKLLVCHCVREDDELLFGFATAEERELFTLLNGVSGVGPKLALSVLSGSSVGELALAISTSDSKRLSAIKGVGKKTAEKICVELKDRVNAFAFTGAGARKTGADDSSKPNVQLIRDVIAALTKLGFDDETSNRMVMKAMDANPGIADTGTLIRKALSAK